MEVRKKRTFIQREDPAEVAARAAQAVQAEQENQELVRREEEARQEVAKIANRKAQLVQERQERQERERKEREAEERARAYAQAEAAKLRRGQRSQKEAAAEAAAAAARAHQSAGRSPPESRARSPGTCQGRGRSRQRPGGRRRKALAEAEAIRAMMAAPKKVLVAKKPEEPKEGCPRPRRMPRSSLPHKDGQACRQRWAANAGGRATAWQGSQVGQAVFERSNDAGEEEGNQDPWRQSGGVGRSNWRGGPRGWPSR